MPDVRVHLNARLQPMHRGERYEDPVQDLLDRRGLGGQVTGGGTLASAEGEPLSCDIEVELPDELAADLAWLPSALEALGAPRGSTVAIEGAEPIAFGRTEGVGVYLDGQGLPDEVYAQSDVNVLIEQLLAALGDDGGLQSWWEGSRETALYLYGGSGARLRGHIAPVLATHPLAQGCRVVDL
jgi:hypothetical protein